MTPINRQPSELQYHNAICEILGIPPFVSPLRLAVLAEREHSGSTELPAAVIEWFAIADAEMWFHRYTNEDNLVPIHELADAYEETAQGWLRVAWENQGVVHWFCKLDGSDNPSVWHDDNTYAHTEFSEIPWMHTSFSFSEFIFDMLSSNHYESWDKGLYISTTSPNLSDATLATLQSHFRQGPFTEEDQRKVYRFYNDKALIYVSHGKSSDKVEWGIHPASQDALREVLSLLKPERAWLENCEVSGTKEGQRILDEYNRNDTRSIP